MAQALSRLGVSDDATLVVSTVAQSLHELRAVPLDDEQFSRLPSDQLERIRPLLAPPASRPARVQHRSTSHIDDKRAHREVQSQLSTPRNRESARTQKLKLDEDARKARDLARASKMNPATRERKRREADVAARRVRDRNRGAGQRQVAKTAGGDQRRALRSALHRDADFDLPKPFRGLRPAGDTNLASRPEYHEVVHLQTRRPGDADLTERWRGGPLAAMANWFESLGVPDSKTEKLIEVCEAHCLDDFSSLQLLQDRGLLGDVFTQVGLRLIVEQSLEKAKLLPRGPPFQSEPPPLSAKLSGTVFPPNAEGPAGIEGYVNAAPRGNGGAGASGWDVPSTKAECNEFGDSHERQGGDGCGGNGRGQPASDLNQLAMARDQMEMLITRYPELRQMHR